MSLNADWATVKALYAQGFNFSQIAKRTNLPPGAIRKHAERAGWKATQASVTASVLSDSSTAERAQNWVVRMMALVETQMSQLESKCKGKVGVKALETLVRVANSLDVIARRTFGLDSEARVQHLVVHRGSDIAEVPTKGAIVDVSSTVSTVPNVDSVAPNECPAPEISEKPNDPAS